MLALNAPVLGALALGACTVPPAASVPEAKRQSVAQSAQPDELVRAVQQALFRLHYLSRRDVTGRNEPRTRRAIITAERTNGMHDDGLVTQHLLKRLRAPGAVAAQQTKPIDAPSRLAAASAAVNAAAGTVADWVVPLPLPNIVPVGASPPAVRLNDPVVQDTATLLANQTRFVLHGVRGLAGDYAVQLQSYINQHDHQVACTPEGTSEQFTCMVDNTINLAAVALVNGAAVIAIDASDAFIQQQADAVSHHRGVWAGLGEDPLQPASGTADPCEAMPCRAAQNILPVNH